MGIYTKICSLIFEDLVIDNIDNYKLVTDKGETIYGDKKILDIINSIFYYEYYIVHIKDRKSIEEYERMCKENNVCMMVPLSFKSTRHLFIFGGHNTKEFVMREEV